MIISMTLWNFWKTRMSLSRRQLCIKWREPSLITLRIHWSNLIVTSFKEYSTLALKSKMMGATPSTESAIAPYSCTWALLTLWQRRMQTVRDKQDLKWQTIDSQLRSGRLTTAVQSGLGSLGRWSSRVWLCSRSRILAQEGQGNYRQPALTNWLSRDQIEMKILMILIE